MDEQFALAHEEGQTAGSVPARGYTEGTAAESNRYAHRPAIQWALILVFQTYGRAETPTSATAPSARLASQPVTSVRQLGE